MARHTGFPGVPGRRRGVVAALALGWAAAGCRSLVDPPLPSGAVPLAAPAVYARWWAMTEACSGLQRSFGDITWYVVPGARSFPNGRAGEANGYYSNPGGEIVLAGQAQLDATVVRHEMLHALLRGASGHPRDYFLARCAGVVTCGPECVSDAGPAAAPPAGTPTVGAGALRVTAELSTATPSASRDEGWFTLTVTATNPAPTAVVLARGTLAYDYGFGVDVTQPPSRAGNGVAVPVVQHDELIRDAAARQFAPGETKRYVFDLHLVASPQELPGQGGDVLGDTRLLPGAYVFRGAWGGVGVGPTSSAIAATLAP